MGSSTAFRFGGGATWLDLLATSGRTFGSTPIERLPTPAVLDGWLEAVGLAPARPCDDADLAGAVALREALREGGMSAVAGRACSPTAVAIIDAAIAQDQAKVRFDGARVATPRAAFGLIAREAVLALSGTQRAMLTECSEHDCRWIFLDPSGRRRWCPEPSCATRGRVRAHRARRQSDEGGTTSS